MLVLRLVGQRLLLMCVVLGSVVLLLALAGAGASRDGCVCHVLLAIVRVRTRKGLRRAKCRGRGDRARGSNSVVVEAVVWPPCMVGGGEWEGGKSVDQAKKESNLEGTQRTTHVCVRSLRSSNTYVVASATIYRRLLLPKEGGGRTKRIHTHGAQGGIRTHKSPLKTKKTWRVRQSKPEAQKSATAYMHIQAYTLFQLNTFWDKVQRRPPRRNDVSCNGKATKVGRLADQ